MNKEESFPQLFYSRLGDLQGRQSAPYSDVGRGTSKSDKEHFPQKQCSLILDYKHGHGRQRWRKEKKKALNNINNMKHS